MTRRQPVAVCLMGPTASGKTELALALADVGPFEIVSVDSALVYRGLDIGTAKPDAEILERYPHHLIDIRDPVEPYSAANFRVDVLQVMDEIRNRGHIPLLVGGSMLYFKALRDGLADMPPANTAIRESIQALADEGGWSAVHARLGEVDPEAAARINPNDPQRLQRALEVYELSGKSMTRLHQESQYRSGEPCLDRNQCPYHLCQIAVVPPDRARLHTRIEQRFMKMLEVGLVAEVQRLYDRGDLEPTLPAIKAVGYRQVWQYLEGGCDYATMVEKGIAATRQLAKRQLTWLRTWPDIAVIESPDSVSVLKILKSGSILE
ncbi:MAG: tRNA (adenosine(37)-N6)-dimethylallyltransferase MiaA [Pseudomonadales bacterium]